MNFQTADRTSVEDILKRVKVQKEVVRCKKIAYKLQCPSFSYSTMHYAVVILLLQSPAFLWLSELSNCRTHICGKHFEESESAKRSCVMQNSLKKNGSFLLSVAVLRSCWLLAAERAFFWFCELSNCRTHNCGKNLKVAKLDFCFRHSFSVAYCVKSHMATLRSCYQMLAIFSSLQWSALVGGAADASTVTGWAPCWQFAVVP